MHLIHVAAAVAEETASTARHVSLAFMARERARACALCKKTCGHENGIRHMISGVGDKLREFYWRPVIGDVVVWERGGRNPVRSVIPATLIYLGASPDRDGGGRWIKRARRNGRNSSRQRYSPSSRKNSGHQITAPFGEAKCQTGAPH